MSYKSGVLLTINGISDNDIVVNHDMNFSGHFIKEIADGIETTDAISLVANF